TGLMRRQQLALVEAQRLGRMGSWEWEIEADIVTWSEQLYRMFCCDPKRLPPPFAEHAKLVTPESWDALSEAVCHTLKTGEPYELEIRNVRPDGGLGTQIVRGEVVRDEHGAIVAMRGTTQDISERATTIARQVEDLRQAAFARAVGETTRSLRVDVNPFTNGILDAVRGLRAACPPDPRQLVWIDYIESLSEGLDELLRPTR
ncbi:MAG: PAS domain-containing protein, partial [Caldimonas sp.]